MTRLPGDEERRTSTIQVDFYKVKLRPREADLGEDPPTTWRQVAEQVNRHLMRLASAPTRLLTETLEGVTRLVRGLSTVPGAIGSRIERAHVHADAKEAAAQEPGLASTSSPHRSSQVSELEAILDRCRVEGLLVRIVRGPGGIPTIVILKPHEDQSLPGMLHEVEAELEEQDELDLKRLKAIARPERDP